MRDADGCLMLRVAIPKVSLLSAVVLVVVLCFFLDIGERVFGV